MKKISFLIAALLLAVLLLAPSCRKELYTDEDALAAMKEAIKYKNDLEKELMALELTNQLQLEGLRSQLSMKETRAADSLSKIGAKTSVSLQVSDVTGTTSDMSGFSVTVNQSGVAKTQTTDANGFVVFPDFVSGSASLIVTKTGFARAAGIMTILTSSTNRQQAVLVPVFPTTASTGKISGTLSAQLDLTTESPEVVKGGILTLNFFDVTSIMNNPNSTLSSTYNLAGIIYDGGFMQTVKTGADGKYEFLIPKTKGNIIYQLSVSTIQKNQKLLFGDNPNPLDSMKVDSLPVYFGYKSNVANYNKVVYQINGSDAQYPGVNISIEAPAGGQTPTAAADIDWAHNDSTVVTWSFSKFAFGNGSSEFTNITQIPVFVHEYNPDLVRVITPANGTINITNGKVISLYMTNGGEYKEYGRFWDENIAPTQASVTKFKFFEELSDEDAANWSEDTTYQTAKATATVILHKGRVKVAFNMSNDVSAHRKGKGYTAIPNVEFHIQTPHTADSILTQNNLKVNLLQGGSLSIDTLILSAHYASTTGFVPATPIFSTYKKDGLTQNYFTDHWVTATPSNTYKVELLNGFKIADGGLGYKTAPKVRIKNYARKQGTTTTYEWQTIAEATTTIDASGRIIAVSDPVMLDNFEIQYSNVGHYHFSSNNEVSVPVNVSGLAQAYARATVDGTGKITAVALYNEKEKKWYPAGHLNYYSGQGYVTTPKVKVTPVGKTTVEKPAELKAVVANDGRIEDIIIVNGGLGYDVRNNDKAIATVPNLIGTITTNGSSDFVYNINMGSGWHGPASSSIF